MNARPKLLPNTLYLGDNGRCTCADHAGATAQATGRDLSGLSLVRLSDADIRYARESMRVNLKCETCGLDPLATERAS